jgi:hypothetical protein
MASTSAQETEGSEIDPIWTTSRTARQIYALGEVDKVRYLVQFKVDLTMNIHQDITRLLELAASSISLLTLPQTDGTEDDLPQGEERSEQFVLEVSEYFERLDVCFMYNIMKPCYFSSTFNSRSKWPLDLHWHISGIRVSHHPRSMLPLLASSLHPLELVFLLTAAPHAKTRGCKRKESNVMLGKAFLLLLPA